MSNPLLKEDYNINPKYPLRQEQIDCIEFLLNRRFAVNALQTGLGKTFATLTAAQNVVEYSDKIHVIVVCPAEANNAFHKTFRMIKQPYNMQTVQQTLRAPKARYSLYNYSSISKYSKEVVELLKSKKVLLITDEAHALQSSSSALAAYMNRLRKYVYMCWSCTATPLLNNIEGLFNLINFTRPGYLINKENFMNKYTYREKVRHGRNVKMEVIGYKNLDKLSQALKDIVIIRALKYNLKFHYLSTELSPEQERAYKLAANAVLGDPKKNKGKKSSYAARLHDLQKVVDNCHPDFTISKGLTEKEKLLLTLIKKKIDVGESVLIYTEYIDTLDRVKDLCIRAKNQGVINISRQFEISGRIQKKKRYLVENSMEKSSVVIVTQAGCQSINLQKSNNIVFYDTPFSVQRFIQMVGRITRMDSKFDYQNIYTIEARGTIDTYKVQLIKHHSSIVTSVFGDQPTLPTDLLMLSLEDKKKLKMNYLWKYFK